MSYGGSTGAGGPLSGKTDVALNNPLTGHLFAYDGTTGTWTNRPLKAIVGSLPTSSAGLAAGALYINNGVVTVYTVSTTPAIIISSVSTSNGTTTLLGTFTNGAPSAVTATIDGAPVTVTSPVITTTSGSGASAGGTYSLTFTTPATGSHMVIIKGTGTYAATSSGYAFTITAAHTVSVTIVSPAFYVSPSGSDNNVGTAASPFQTLAKAQSSMQSSLTKTVYIRDGTYTLSSALSLGSADIGTAWLGYPGETPIIDGNGSLACPITLSFGTQNVTIDHLTVRNCVNAGIYLHGGQGNAIVNGNTISNNTIYNVSCTITNGAGRAGGIWLDFLATNNTISNNLIYDTQSPSITLASGSSNESMVGNQILYNRCLRSNNSGQHDSGGIYVLDRNHEQLNILIEGNYVEDCSVIAGAPGADCDNTKGIYLDDETSYVTVRKNIVTGKGAMGLQIHGGNNTTWENNIFDITQYLLLALYQHDAEYGNFGMANNSFSKNIVYSSVTYNGNVGQAGQPGLWTVLAQGNAIATPSASNNVYWNTATPFPNQNDVVDSNPHVNDPHFTNAAAHDYSFTDGGSAVNSACGFVAIDQSLIGPTAQTIVTATATLSGVSSSSTVNGTITGTCSLQNITTAYAVLYTAGAEEGSRVSFASGPLPSLHPANQGAYKIRIYTASSGGSLLAESDPINVSAGVSSGSISDVVPRVNVGQSVFGLISLTNTVNAYAVLYTNGAEQGSRALFTGSALPALIPSAQGSYTLRVFDAASGGTMLAESSAINVSPAGTLVSPAFFVSPSGNDSNSGTSGSPFLTFEKAQSAMRAGSTKTVYIRGGTYARATKFSMAAADNGTSWLGYPGETPVIDAGNTTVDVFWLDYHTANITFDHLTFKNGVDSFIHLNGYQTSGDDGTITGVIVANCTFEGLSSSLSGAGNTGAIRASFATRNNLFRNNLITGCYGPGISLVAGGSNEWAIGNKLVRNKFINMNNTGQSDTGAIYFLDRGHNGVADNPTIVDSNYVENAGNGNDVKHIYFDDEFSCVRVTNNIFCSAAQYGLQVHGGDHVVFTNNIFDITDTQNVGAHYLALYQDAVGVGYTNYGMAANSFTRNIVYSAGQYTQSQMWSVIDDTNGQITLPSVSGNLYYKSSGTFPNTGQVVDTNAIITNPNFVDASGRNYAFSSMNSANQIGFVPISQAAIGPQ